MAPMARTKTGSPLDEFDILEVAPPRFDTKPDGTPYEKVIPLFEAVPTKMSGNNLIRKLTGSDIPGSTMNRWANKPGYPLGEKRYIRLPAARKAVRDPVTKRTVARSVTTKEAIERFVARCAKEGSPIHRSGGIGDLG